MGIWIGTMDNISLKWYVVCMLILGSTSPRRKEILSFFRVPFSAIPSQFDESTIPTTVHPKEYVEKMARKKGEEFVLSPSDTLLTADTIVVLGTQILGKPASIDHAVEMLLSLSNTMHEVITGVCVRFKDTVLVRSATTRVLFLPITEKQARAYATHFNVLDKAGAYAIQEGGGIIIDKIEGCFYNVMGLPLRLTVDMLSEAGIHIWDILGNV